MPGVVVAAAVAAEAAGTGIVLLLRIMAAFPLLFSKIPLNYPLRLCKCICVCARVCVQVKQFICLELPPCFYLDETTWNAERNYFLLLFEFLF